MPWLCPARLTSPGSLVIVSAADAETVDQGLVARFVDPLDVVEQRTARLHQLQQAAARMVVLAVTLEVFGEVGDALGEDRDLDFRRAGVALFGGVFIDERGLALGSDRHRKSPLVFEG